MLLKNNAASRLATAHPAPVVAAPAAPPPAPGPALVRTFVETNDWTDASLDSFSRRWSTLGTDEQTKARGSMMYPRLVADLHQQITSEKAVAGSGADAHLMALQKMAKTLGIAGAP